jgi:hypothetical protein
MSDSEDSDTQDIDIHSLVALELTKESSGEDIMEMCRAISELHYIDLISLESSKKFSVLVQKLMVWLVAEYDALASPLPEEEEEEDNNKKEIPVDWKRLYEEERERREGVEQEY